MIYNEFINRERGKGMKKIRPISIFSALFAVGAVIALFFVVKITLEQGKAHKVYDEVIASAVSMPEEPKKEETKPSLPKVDFEALSKMSDEVVGWIYCPDSPINYPVMQGEDNQKYVSVLPNGKKNSAGSIFADHRQSPFGTDRNFIIYGHNMKNDSMFGTLIEYRKQAYFESHPVFYYFTPDGAYIIELYAGFHTEATLDFYNVYMDEEQAADYMANARRRSTFASDIEYKEGDRIVTLSTCVTGDENDLSRYVLVGVAKPLE